MVRRQVEIPRNRELVDWWMKLTEQAEYEGDRVVVHHTVTTEFVTDKAMERVPWYLGHGYPIKVVRDSVEVWVESDE